MRLFLVGNFWRRKGECVKGEERRAQSTKMRRPITLHLALCALYFPSKWRSSRAGAGSGVGRLEQRSTGTSRDPLWGPFRVDLSPYPYNDSRYGIQRNKNLVNQASPVHENGIHHELGIFYAFDELPLLFIQSYIVHVKWILF